MFSPGEVVMGKRERRILLSGASGLIGSALHRAAQKDGIEVTTLVRRHHLVRAGAIYWNPRRQKNTIHPLELEGFDAFVHLSGANVGRRWTQKYRAVSYTHLKLPQNKLPSKKQRALPHWPASG